MFLQSRSLWQRTTGEPSCDRCSFIHVISSSRTSLLGTSSRILEKEEKKRCCYGSAVPMCTMCVCVCVLIRLKNCVTQGFYYSSTFNLICIHTPHTRGLQWAHMPGIGLLSSPRLAMAPRNVFVNGIVSKGLGMGNKMHLIFIFLKCFYILQSVPRTARTLLNTTSPATDLISRFEFVCFFFTVMTQQSEINPVHASLMHHFRAMEIFYQSNKTIKATFH